MQILLPPTSESERLTNLARTLGEADYKDWIWKQRDAEHRRRFASTAGQPAPTFVRRIEQPIFHNQEDQVNLPQRFNPGPAQPIHVSDIFADAEGRN